MMALRTRLIHLAVPVCFVLALWLAFSHADRLADFFRRIPGSAFISSHRWLTFSIAVVLLLVGKIILAPLRRCPVCHKRGFTREYSHGAGEDWTDRLAYGVRHCSSCGTRQVETVRGKQILAEKDWYEEAARYAGWRPPPATPKRGFEVILKEPDDSDPIQ